VSLPNITVTFADTGDKWTAVDVESVEVKHDVLKVELDLGRGLYCFPLRIVRQWILL
jgi:hypothetical protein